SRLRRSGPQAAADHYREISGRSRGREHPGCGPGRRAGRDRRNLRTVPDPDWLPEPHPARARGYTIGLRAFWDHTQPQTEFVILVVGRQSSAFRKTKVLRRLATSGSRLILVSSLL